jgi:hypothetical protein
MGSSVVPQQHTHIIQKQLSNDVICQGSSDDQKDLVSINPQQSSLHSTDDNEYNMNYIDKHFRDLHS